MENVLFNENLKEIQENIEKHKQIFLNNGFGIADARNAINIVYDIRNATPVGLKGDYHPMAALPLVKHPFGW